MNETNNMIDPMIYKIMSDLIKEELDLFIDESNNNDGKFGVKLGTFNSDSEILPCLIINDMYIIPGYTGSFLGNLMVSITMSYEYNKFMVTTPMGTKSRIKDDQVYVEWTNKTHYIDEYNSVALEILESMIKSKISEITNHIDRLDIFMSEDFSNSSKIPYYQMCILYIPEGDFELDDVDALMITTPVVYCSPDNSYVDIEEIDQSEYDKYNIHKYTTVGIIMNSMELMMNALTNDNLARICKTLYVENCKIIPHPTSLRKSIMDRIMTEMSMIEYDILENGLLTFAISAVILTFIDEEYIKPEYKKDIPVYENIDTFMRTAKEKKDKMENGDLN